MKSRSLWGAAGALVLAAGMTAAATPAYASTQWWVDSAAPNCSNSGPGSSDTPLCTISAAAAKAVSAGDSVSVRPGTYAEQVTVAASGASGAPITFAATAPGVLVLGTRDLATATWTAFSGGTWSTPYAPPSAPRQVFYGGSRLQTGTSASALSTGQFFYDSTAKVLYSNVGGDSPAAVGHTVTAGAQTYGFNVVGRTNVAISGFELKGQNNAGVRVSGSTAVSVDRVSSDDSGINGVLLESSSNSVTVTNSSVTDSASIGIKLSATSSSRVAGSTVKRSGLHGISLTTSTGNIIEGNESADNLVTSGTATAAGIDVNTSSSDTVVRGNLLHGNQDSGVQVYNVSDRALVIRNVSYANGDHGFDTLKSVGVVYVSNTSHGNRNDGFSIEGVSTGASLRDNVSVDNGLATAGSDLYIEATSATGFSGDSDMFWNSAWVPAVKIGITTYRTMADYAAAGQEPHGIGMDPHFVDAASGDLRLSANSPAIDCADTSASGFEPVDRTGTSATDDPTVADTGTGSLSYADRGALERSPQAGDLAANPPHAVLLLSTTTGQVPPAVTVTADATGSSDPDAQGIATYSFDFGDGTTVGPQTSGSAQHTYTTGGARAVTVTVTDAGGAQGTAASSVSLTNRTLVTYHVDIRDPSCSDGANGTTTPFCSISRAAALALAGDTVLVNPGDYLEQVTPASTGMSGAPLTFRAAGAGVRIIGTTDLSGATWSNTSTTAWSATVAAASPVTQVFLDGQRLAKADSATTTTAGSFFYDASAARVYVDLGGASPGPEHTVLVSTRSYGFKLWGADNVVVDGFTTVGQNVVGISVQDSTAMLVAASTAQAASAYGVSSDRTTGITVTGSSALSNGSIGLRIATTTGATVSNSVSHDNAFHGISVQSSTGATVSGNVAYANVQPTQRAAAGIDISANSPGAVVEDNTTYNNQDSGIEIYTGSDSATVRRNIIYDNGDHGLDCLMSTDDRVIGNTVVGNSAAGINFEGGCSGSTVADNISVDNAIGSTRTIGDLRLDEASALGSTVTRNLMVMTAGGPLYEWNSAPYTTVAAFQAASGQGAFDLASDPKFVSLAGRNLNLTLVSPAVDSADLGVPGAAAIDHDGVAPVDVAGVPDTGAGVPAYADRGALEYHGSGATASGPTARLGLTPASGPSPLSVVADASTSTAGDAPISSYAFACGNDTGIGPQPGPTATCTYTAEGTYTLTVTAVDSNGLSSVAAQTVTAEPPNQAPVARLSATPTSGVAPMAATLDASASTDPEGRPLSFTFDCGNGTTVGPQTGPAATCTYTTAATFAASVTVTDSGTLTSQATTTISVAQNRAPIAKLVMTAPPGSTAPTAATFSASDSFDPEGGPLTYTFTCGNGMTVGPQALPTATCAFTSGGTFNVRVAVTDAQGLSTNSPNIKLVIASNKPPTASMTVNLSSTRAPATATINASASRDPEGGPLTFTYVCGNGTTVGPTASSIASCSYGAAGHYTIKLTVKDNTGQTATASFAVKL